MKPAITVFLTIVSSFFSLLDILLSSADFDDEVSDSKKNSSLAWGNTHDDGWID